MNKSRFDKAFASFIRRGEEKITPKTFFQVLANLASRVDLNYLFEEMLGELSLGHVFVWGGEMPEVKKAKVGLLGADYKIENGRYRFARVYNGENWNPQLRAPLTQPGVNMDEIKMIPSALAFVEGKR